MDKFEFEEKRISIILGTSRPNSFTSKAIRPILDELRCRNIKFDIIDPSKLKLFFPGIDGDNTDEKNIKDICSVTDGIIFATPEYHGSMSASAKLIIENLGFPSVLAGKPIVIMGVAEGSAGAIKGLEHLRSVLSHVGAIVLPGPVSVAKVSKVFSEDGLCVDPTIENKLRGLVRILIDFIDQ